MDGIEKQIQNKYINELILFYGCKLSNIDNSMIIRFLLYKKYIPGTKPYIFLNNYFQKKSRYSFPCFFLLEKKYELFRKDLYNLFRYLSRLKIKGQKIIKYQNLLTEFSCWLFLNDFQFDLIGINHLNEFLIVHNYRKNHPRADDILLIEALNYFYLMKNNDTMYINIENISLKPELPGMKDLYHNNKYLLRAINNDDLKILFLLILNTGLSWKTIIRISRKDVNLIWQILNYKSENSNLKLIILFDSKIKNFLMNYFTLDKPMFLLNSLNDTVDESFMEKKLQNKFNFELLNSRNCITNSKELLDNFYNIFSGEMVNHSYYTSSIEING
jgi:hypothetical protein